MGCADSGDEMVVGVVRIIERALSGAIKGIDRTRGWGWVVWAQRHPSRSKGFLSMALSRALRAYCIAIIRFVY